MSDQFNLTDEDVQMPLGLAGDGGSEPTEIPFSEEKKPRFNPATLLLFGVFAAGLALIYTMSLHAKPRSASASENANASQVDSAIAALLNKTGDVSEINGLSKDAQKLVALFHSIQDGSLAREQLAGNPFARSNVPSSPLRSILNVSNSNDAAQQEKLRKAADAFAQLKLESVMKGQSRNAAMINHKIYLVGAKVGDFTIVQIEANRVVLTYGVAKFELKLQPKGLEVNN
jgi:hypothetical protein